VGIAVEEPVVGVFPKEVRFRLSPRAAEFIQVSHLEFRKEAKVVLKFCSALCTAKAVLNRFSFISPLQSKDVKLCRGSSVTVSPFYA